MQNTAPCKVAKKGFIITLGLVIRYNASQQRAMAGRSRLLNPDKRRGSRNNEKVLLRRED